MKTVYLFRHGLEEFLFAQGGGERLSKDGTIDVIHAALEIKRELATRDVMILSSDTPRASLSAEVFSSILGQPRSVSATLRGGHYNRVQGIEDAIRQVTDAGIIITHRANIEDFTQERYGRAVTLPEGKYVLIQTF